MASRKMDVQNTVFKLNAVVNQPKCVDGGFGRGHWAQVLATLNRLDLAESCRTPR